LGKGESTAGKAELEARAQSLEDPASVSDQLLREFHGLSQSPSSSAKESKAASATNRGETSWRIALALELLKMCSDLLAMQQHGNPSQLGALREIQEQSERLLEQLRARQAVKTEDPGQANEPPISPSR
jgi:hypothetical protein